MKSLFLSALAFSLALSPLSAEDKPAEIKAGSLTFKAAAPWTAKAEPRPMSAGGLTLPGKDGAQGVEADFYCFGTGQGGDIEANMKRWQSQFLPGDDGKAVEPQREDSTVGTHKVHYVLLKGTFLSGPAMSPKKTPVPGSAMIGAIIEHADGNVFIKVTGPEKAVTALQEDVKKLVASALGK